MQTVLEDKKLDKNYIYIFLIILYWGLFIAEGTSPFLKNHTVDSFVFYEIGRGIVNGKVPYRDLMDHKGPIIFLFNALPQLFINGTFGVWLFEMCYLTISTFFIYKIVKNVVNSKIALFSTIVFLCILGLSVGNLTENYSIYLGTPVFLMFINYTYKNMDSFPLHFGLVSGSMFMLSALTRVTNSVIIFGICIGCSVYLIQKKQYSNLIKNILAFVVGAVVVFIPIGVWLNMNEAFEAMVSASIFQNISYSKNGSAILDNIFSLGINTLYSKVSIIFMIFVSAFLYRKKDVVHATTVLVLGILTFIAVNLSPYSFEHYSLMFVLPIVYSIVMFFRHYLATKYTKLLITISVVMLSLFLALGMYKIYRNFFITTKYDTYIEQSKELSEHLPSLDKADVYAIGVLPLWYDTMGVDPNYKYFTLQNWMCITYPPITDEILNHIDIDRPTWIISSKFRTELNESVGKLIDDNYKLIYQNESAELYKLDVVK